MWVLTHDSNRINQRLWVFGVPWSPGFVWGLPPRGGLWKQSKWPWNMLQSVNPSRSTLQPQSNQNFRHFTCMREPVTYWNFIGLQMRMHQQEHIHKSIWTMFGVRWSSSPLTLSFIVDFRLRSHKQYGITLLPQRTNLVDLLEFVVLHFYDYEQFNAPPSTNFNS